MDSLDVLKAMDLNQVKPMSPGDKFITNYEKKQIEPYSYKEIFPVGEFSDAALKKLHDTVLNMIKAHVGVEEIFRWTGFPKKLIYDLVEREISDLYSEPYRRDDLEHDELC